VVPLEPKSRTVVSSPVLPVEIEFDVGRAGRAGRATGPTLTQPGETGPSSITARRI